MTDTEIIKAFNNLIHLGDAPIGKDYGVIVDKQTLKEALDLINRQQAEIERSGLASNFPHHVLTSYALICTRTMEEYDELIADISNEAVKGFAEQVKQTICENTHPDFNREGKPVNVWNAKDGYRAIDNLLKEMG